MKNKRLIPVKKNNIYTITARDLSSDGHGIGSVENFTVFCPGLLPGETGKVLIIKVSGGYAVGKLLSLERPAACRREKQCAVYAKCGGCTLGHLSYDAQADWKEKHVHDCLERIGGITGYFRDPILKAEHPLHYRNKIQYRLGTVDGQAVCGFYRPRSHTLVPVSECEIQMPEASAIRTFVLSFINKHGISVYDEDSHTGLLRGIMVRTSHKDGTSMLVLVINGETLPEQEAFLAALPSALPQVGSVYLNVNTARTNVFLGERFLKLYGTDFLRDAIGTAQFDISPVSFFQVNPEQTEKLYNTVREFAALTPDTALFDLYCGIGSIGIFLAKDRALRSLTGIEYVPHAIEDAKRNAALNGLSDYTFYAGDVAEILTEKSLSLAHPDVIVLDPPRKGCDSAVLSAAAELAPDRIVYVSCNPATLARDLKQLEALRYFCRRVRPVDMFPETGHVETVCLLDKQKPNAAIKRSVNTEDCDRIKEDKETEG